MQHHSVFLWMHGSECQSRNRSSCAPLDSRMSKRVFVTTAGSGSSERTISLTASGTAHRAVPVSSGAASASQYRCCLAAWSRRSVLEPRVPGDAHAREQRYLLAPQPWGATARASGHAEVLWRQPRPPRPQELAQLLAAALRRL